MECRCAPVSLAPPHRHLISVCRHSSCLARRVRPTHVRALRALPPRRAMLGVPWVHTDHRPSWATLMAIGHGQPGCHAVLTGPRAYCVTELSQAASPCRSGRWTDLSTGGEFQFLFPFPEMIQICSKFCKLVANSFFVQNHEISSLIPLNSRSRQENIKSQT
jgi:hypothetical protein